MTAQSRSTGHGLHPPHTGWQPLMLALDVPAGTVTGARIGTQRLAIWRDADGAVHAADDRCPHRGMRLSLGFVRENTLACLYHGWRFDQTGRCRVIPAHPDVTPASTIRVPVFPVTERLGIIWCRTEDMGDTQPDAAWHLPDPAAVTPVRTLTIRASLSDILTALPHTGTGCLRVSLDEAPDGSHTLLILPRELEDGGTQLHLVLEGSASLAACEHAALWAVALRDRLEHADAMADV